MNKRAGLTAADIVNTYEEEKLADIFYLYGELKNSRKLASVIVKARATQRIATIGEFLEIVKPLFGRERGNRSAKAGRPPGGDNLSLPGRPYGEEYHENRQRGRQGRKRFFRERIDPVPASQQQSDCTGRGRDRAQSAFAQRQAENCRKSNE